MFRNVTTSAGITYRGRTWAATWGDFDEDGLPDFWVTKHNSHLATLNAEDGTLFRNRGDGTFTNVSPQQVQYLKRDMHGSAWADFDHDGDLDLAVVHSEQRGLTVFENGPSGSVQHYLQDVTPSLGFGLRPVLLGRNPLWLDYNRDGLLDLYFGADRVSDVQTSVIFRQAADGTFVNANAEVGLTASAATPLLADLNMDGSPELIFTRYGALAEIFNTNTPTGQWQNIHGSLLGQIQVPAFDDYVIADFNNDLRPDIYFTRAGYADEVALHGDRQLRATIAEPARAEKGFSFETDGNPTFTFSRQDGTMNFDTIRVGSQGLRPVTNVNRPVFTLSASNPDHQGIMPHTINTPGIYIGFDAAAQEWEVDVVGRVNPRAGWLSRGFLVDSPVAISELEAHGFALDPVAAPDQLLINTRLANGNTRFVDQSVTSGIAAMEIHGSNLAAADFDNDGDVDIYVDQAGPAINRPNLLLVNQGSGRFVSLAGADGAGGPDTGTGGAVAVADYDRDGFLDVLSANGGAAPPFIPLNDGPLQLFHNTGPADGNANHWVEIRLHGVQSNADAVGAKVLVTAGGRVQMREAVNGSHVEAQDDQVLHFGLGQASSITSIEVQWPSSPSVRFTGPFPADELLDITEGSPLPLRLGLLDATGEGLPAPGNCLVSDADAGGGHFAAAGDDAGGWASAAADGWLVL